MAWQVINQQINIIMNKVKPLEPEQEGFQQFHDITENINYNTELLKHYNPQKTTTKVLDQYSPTKNKPFFRKLPSKNKTILPEINPNIEKSNSQIPISQTPMNQKQLVQKDRTQKYQRIPIVRKDEQLRYSGPIVYRGFVPRSSDHYFRVIKDVTFEPIQTNKVASHSQQLEFNSKFQSGNLNLAIRGF